MKRVSGASAVALLMFASTGFAVEMLEISAERANVRSGPGTKHDIVTSLSEGDRYEVLGQKGEWVQIMYLVGVKGWVHGELGDIVFTEEKRPKVVKQFEAGEILVLPKRQLGDLSAGMVEFGGGMLMNFSGMFMTFGGMQPAPAWDGGYFIHLEPTFGYFATEQIELAGTIGLMSWGDDGYSTNALALVGSVLEHFETGSPTVPYGLLGLGFVNFSTSSYGYDDSESGLLLRFGGGGRIFVTDTWNIRAELRFEKIFIENVDLTANVVFYITGLKAP